jgi:cold shock CspA family protein
MKIHKYIPHKFYGFAVDEHGMQVFFHLESFDSGGTNPPPIVGEEVDVDVDLQGGYPSGGRAPKAQKVVRVFEPQYIGGTIRTFDVERGYGFISGDDGEYYHLHRSEVLGGKFPLTGQRVQFYVGFRQNRPRACHVEIGVEDE